MMSATGRISFIRPTIWPTGIATAVGQIVGRMNEIRPVADIIGELVSGFEEATKRLDGIAGS